MEYGQESGHIWTCYTILSVTDGEARASELNKTIKDLSKRNRFSLTAFCKTRNKEFQTLYFGCYTELLSI